MSTKQQIETKKRTRNVIPYYAVVVLTGIAVMVMTVFAPVWDQFPVEIIPEIGYSSSGRTQEQRPREAARYTVTTYLSRRFPQPSFRKDNNHEIC